VPMRLPLPGACGRTGRTSIMIVLLAPLARGHRFSIRSPRTRLPPLILPYRPDPPSRPDSVVAGRIRVARQPRTVAGLPLSPQRTGPIHGTVRLAQYPVAVIRAHPPDSLHSPARAGPATTRPRWLKTGHRHSSRPPPADAPPCRAAGSCRVVGVRDSRRGMLVPTIPRRDLPIYGDDLAVQETGLLGGS
jgi:hypothetical protein